MSEKTKMTVKEFVDKYNETKSQNERLDLVKSIIRRNYSPVLEKKMALQIMLKKTVVVSPTNEMFLDMFLSKINFIMAILVLYTDLDIVKKEDDKKTNFDDYDLLQQNGLIEIICSCIGEEEINELTMVQDALFETFYNEHCSTSACISKQVFKLSEMLTSLVDPALIKNDFLTAFDLVKQNT